MRLTSFCLLTLLLTSLSGCPKRPHELPVPRPPVCGSWNRLQLEGWYTLVQVAEQTRTQGDPFGVAAAVDKIGTMLVGCGIIQPDAD